MCSKTRIPAGFPQLTLLCTILLILLTQSVDLVKGERIVCINFFSSKSHKITYEPLLLALAERGHDVTYVGTYLSGKKVPNLREISALTVEEIEKEVQSGGNFFDIILLQKALGPLVTFFSPFLMFAGPLEQICRKSYALPAVQAVLKEKFDLIIFLPFFNDCVYGAVHKLNATTVLFQQVTAMQWVAASLGTPSPPSFVPFIMEGFTDVMSYTERLRNFISIIYNWFVFNLYYYPKMERVYREALGDPTIPSIPEIERNSSIVLANSHVSITRPRPLMPDIIDVGGLHLKPAKALTGDLADFINGSGEYGFILFSFGSALKGSDMPESNRKMFLNVFAKLKQRVLWKWETEKMDDLPPNVKLSKWLPQPDVLGDKRCRLFITHGGHGGTTEAVYHGVPLIGIPMLGDQPANMQKAAALGYAIKLEFTELTEEILTNAIEEILFNPSYQEKAKKLSNVYRDQIDKPMDRAIYWIEYVIRHQGAMHLRSAARYMSIIQYYSLDVIGTLLVLAILSAAVNFLIIRSIIRKCLSKGQSKATSKDSKRRTSKKIN